MTARLDHSRENPSVFRYLTGLTVPAFDALAADVVPAVETAHRTTPDRPTASGPSGPAGRSG